MEMPGDRAKLFLQGDKETSFLPLETPPQVSDWSNNRFKGMFVIDWWNTSGRRAPRKVIP